MITKNRDKKTTKLEQRESNMRVIGVPDREKPKKWNGKNIEWKSIA